MSRHWWKEAVVYQIYPRSFMDSDGDGIGDLQGIASKLDYLQELGIDVIWLSPIYDSPNDDNGYDIRNYHEIMKEFGTMEQFDSLLLQIHERGMKLVMDLVVNHTSDEHPWFIESRKSKDNPYRDFYIWKPGKDGREPTNWESFFSGSTWTLDETTGEYYLHLFSRRQPDLNWGNEAVRQYVYEMMRWWLDKGIDGFRMDVINAISKVESYPDGPNVNGAQYVWAPQYFLNGPEAHKWIEEMNTQVLSQYDIMTVGETGGVSTTDALLYAGEERQELNMVFQFEHTSIDSSPNDKWHVVPWKLGTLKEIMSRWQTDLHEKAWNSLYLNNHDQPRSVSRFGDIAKYHRESAKMLATFLHMQQGTPYVYQGEEIGMTNVAFDRIEDYRDVEIQNLWAERVVRGGESPDKMMAAIHAKGRDNARTPVQWNADIHAGFTKGEPWIQVAPNYTWINVASQLQDPDSILTYYRTLIRLRKANPIMVYGKYELIVPEHPDVYAYTRTLNAQKWLIILNFFGKQTEFECPSDVTFRSLKRVISNYDIPDEEYRRVFDLRPFECRVYEMRSLGGR